MCGVFVIFALGHVDKRGNLAHCGENPVSHSRGYISCGSERPVGFDAEITIHAPGLHSIDAPAVLVFPKLVICLECGLAKFTVPEEELATLQGHPDHG
jgi:hypothetical protein